MPKIDALNLLAKVSKSCEKVFWDLWWPTLAIIAGLLILEQGLKTLQAEVDQLHQQMTMLQAEKEKAFANKESLKLQINSQSDPVWIELTLKKGLGLVPEGQKKVLFID